MAVIGIMQPYIFPYIGYFQLINSVEKFVIYDDVNFIKQGWINRNNILINGKSSLFTVPLENASSFNLINATKLNQNYYPTWVEKFLKTIEQNYKKAPFYNNAIDLIKEVLFFHCETISELARKSITEVSKFLELKTYFVGSSTRYNNDNLKSQARVLDICLQEKATKYINPIGGKNLYSKEDFRHLGMNLNFISSNPITYKQFRKDEFVPWLSIIDVIMFNSPNEIQEMLNDYELI